MRFVRKVDVSSTAITSLSPCLEAGLAEKTDLKTEGRGRILVEKGVKITTGLLAGVW
jgi:hypothetical protein